MCLATVVWCLPSFVRAANFVLTTPKPPVGVVSVTFVRDVTFVGDSTAVRVRLGMASLPALPKAEERSVTSTSMTVWFCVPALQCGALTRLRHHPATAVHPLCVTAV